MRNQNRRIILPYGNTYKLASELGVSYPHVRNCLKGAYDTETAQKVRKLAIKKYKGRYF